MRRIRVVVDDERHRHQRRPHVHRAHRVRRGGSPDDRGNGRRLDHGRHPLRPVRAVGRRDRVRRHDRGDRLATHVLRHQGPQLGCAPGVGSPDPGLAPIAARSIQVFFLWAPIHWDDRCTHFGVFEDEHGQPLAHRRRGAARVRRPRRHPRQPRTRTPRLLAGGRARASTTCRARGAPGTRASRSSTPTASAKTSTSSRCSASA